MKAAFRIALLLLLPVAATAHDCTKEEDEAAFQRASTVFLARSTGAEPIRGQNPSPIFHHEAEFVRGSFEVVKTYKGEPSTVRFIDANTSVNAAWLPLMVGEQYLIFGGREDSVAMNTCTASRHFVEGREELWIRRHGR